MITEYGSLGELLRSWKTSLGASVTMTVTAIFDFIGQIPDQLIKNMVGLSGVALTMALIMVQRSIDKKNQAEYERNRLQAELLQLQIDEAKRD